MTLRTLLVPIASVGLLLSACGGSDDVSDQGAPAAPDASEQGTDGGQTDGGGQDGDGGQDGTSDEDVQQQLDENGVDVDLDEIGEGMSDFNTGEGGGTIVIDGLAYEYDAEVCIAFETDLTIDGPGTGPDGTPFWGSISVTELNRTEMEELGMMPVQALDALFGDKESGTSVEVDVEVGRTDMFGSGPDDLPQYSAATLLGEPILGSIDYVVSGAEVSGSGEMVDDAFASVPFEFSGNC